MIADAPELPQPHDQEALIPPTERAWTRRVEGANLWIYFKFDDDTAKVTILTVVKSPPYPID